MRLNSPNKYWVYDFISWNREGFKFWMNRSQAEKSLWVIVLSTSNRFKTDNMDLSDRIIYQSAIKLFQSSRRPSPILNYRRNRLKLKNDDWIRINLETIIPHTPVVHLDKLTKQIWRIVTYHFSEGQASASCEIDTTSLIKLNLHAQNS